MHDVRHRFNAFIARHEVGWELGMGVLAVVFVAVGFAQDAAMGTTLAALEALDLVLTGVFVLEFGSRIAASRDRGGYLRGHWIDLVALIPAARGLRVLRLVRLLRLVRTFAGMYRALTHVERLSRHRGLVWLFSAWLGTMVITSTALYVAEVDLNPQMSSPFDAVWWGVVTLTTVGYGDLYPLTPEGRIAAMALMVLGVTLFAGITGTITSFVIQGSEDRAPDAAASLRALAELKEAGLVTAEEFEHKKGELLARL
jgi:voltage-gated potassium channel